MIAPRYTVRLHERTTMRRQKDMNLDPTDDKRLREVLEELVKEEKGDLNRDLSVWSIVVHSLGGGQIKAKCLVTGSGATEVKR